MMNDSCIILQTYNFIDKLICVMNIFMFFYSLSKAAAPCVLPSAAEPITPVFLEMSPLGSLGALKGVHGPFGSSGKYGLCDISRSLSSGEDS